MDKRKWKVIAIILCIIGILLAIIVVNVDRKFFWVGDYNYKFFLGSRRAVIEDYRGNEEEIRIPSSIGPFKITFIEYQAYEGKDFIKSVYIPQKARATGVSFVHCRNLESVICEEGVVELSYYFCDCQNLHEVVLPESLEEIRADAFQDCSSLNKVTIPNNGKRIIIGDSAFKNTEFEVSHKNDSYYVAGDNILIFDNAQSENEIVIPQGVKWDCERTSIEKADIYCPDSLLAAAYIIETDAELFVGAEDFEEINIKGEGTVVAPENSPIAKYCQENGINFRPITEEEDAIRREKTEAAAADVVYQDE
ncbi:leucine-rich repeat domain-containing protein [Butyrivibrio sp. XB500-5]|uniref:leucine-rich repeat domain-containing protein n=1 Tax=Butyrivibrio sp. XB500-5 TaxID=2364880 RepID=UPI001313E84F|nr:leucine-rich repeat domain-containing protein [Butyrivibrio sp. XB500-5]